MNFFQHQDRARQNTKKLVILFALAIVCIVASLYFVSLGVFTFARSAQVDRSEVVYQSPSFVWWNPAVLGGVVAGTFLIIGTGSLCKIYTLGQGGAVVAHSLGGRLIDPETTDPDERKLRNVVEEMAIASGVPMPLVYVLDQEEGLNAFAAGYTPNDAAVAVTTGAMRLLKREELQGVIAHEFSHVLSGDMRLNIRMIGLVHGILIIAIIGMQMIRAAGHSNSREGKGTVGLVAAGAALAVIGYIGVLFGRIIKAAISRQREFLADASAVDFTRNPDGIAGALKKIGGYGLSSRILTPAGEEVSHMLFGDWRVRAFQSSGFLSTHPPLVERVKRIDPSFDGTFPKVEGVARLSPLAKEAAEAQMGLAPGVALRTRTIDPKDVIKQVGVLAPANLEYGAALIAAMPEPLRLAARQPGRAVCLVHALLLDADQAKRETQIAMLRGKLKPELIEETLRLFEARTSLDPAARLPLVDLAIPALRQLNATQGQAFLQQVAILAGADQEISIFEYALQELLAHQLQPLLHGARGRAVQYPAFAPLQADCVTVLSVLARLGQRDPAAILTAYRVGAARLPREPRGIAEEPRSAEACSFTALGEALNRLALAAPILKERIIDALAHCVLADGTVTVEEAELLRTIARCMGCPLPPFLPAAGADPASQTQAA